MVLIRGMYWEYSKGRGSLLGMYGKVLLRKHYLEAQLLNEEFTT